MTITLALDSCFATQCLNIKNKEKHQDKNKGLAKTFTSGLDASLQHGADIIVNTDADNQ